MSATAAPRPMSSAVDSSGAPIPVYVNGGV